MRARARAKEETLTIEGFQTYTQKILWNESNPVRLTTLSLSVEYVALTDTTSGITSDAFSQM